MVQHADGITEIKMIVRQVTVQDVHLPEINMIGLHLFLALAGHGK